MLADPDAILFSARHKDGSLAGAGGLIWRSWNDPAGYAAWIYVLPDSRRQGVGRALLSALAAQGRGELDNLWAIAPLDEEGEGAAFARACGFATERRQLFFEGDARNLLAQIAPAVDLLRRRGRIPATARFVGIGDVPLDELTRLIASEFPAAPPHIAAMLRRSIAADPARAPIDVARSRILMVGDVVAGALLSRRSGENSAHIVCRVVAPAWRNGWTNLALIQEFASGTAAAGCYRVGFDCHEHQRDTIGIAARGGATHIRTEGWFRYALSAAV
jgi:GNAT superfamily N-acetyltransferase